MGRTAVILGIVTVHVAAVNEVLPRLSGLRDVPHHPKLVRQRSAGLETIPPWAKHLALLEGQACEGEVRNKRVAVPVHVSLQNRRRHHVSPGASRGRIGDAQHPARSHRSRERGGREQPGSGVVTGTWLALLSVGVVEQGDDGLWRHPDDFGERFINLRRASGRLGVPLSWLRDEAAAGRVPTLKTGRSVLVNIELVERLLDERAEATVPDGEPA